MPRLAFLALKHLTAPPRVALYECQPQFQALGADVQPAAPGHPLQAGCAQPFTTCFRIGDWFRWNFPSTELPPCATSALKTDADWLNGLPVRQTSGGTNVDPRTWRGWALAQAMVRTGSDKGAAAVCGEADASTDLYTPWNRGGTICNRNYAPEGQNCWGICLAEDVIEPGAMRNYMVTEIKKSVTEAQSMLRLRPRTTPLTLTSSIGHFYGIYLRHNMGNTPECARDARRMYKLPVPDSLCSTGEDADAILYVVMPQYIPGVAGWGSEAGKDQYGRPIVLVMGWSVPSGGGLGNALAPPGHPGASSHHAPCNATLCHPLHPCIT